MTQEQLLYLGADDHEATRCLRVLRRAGFRTFRARHAPEAVIATRARRIPVALFDVRGNERTGLQFLEQLDGCGTVVVVIAEAAWGRTALRHGAWDYVEPKNCSYVRDLPHVAVRAAAFARLQHDCAAARQAVELSSRAAPPPQRSLADAVIAAFANEIRSPLVALRGYSQLLSEPGAFDETVAALASRLEASAQGVTNLVDRLSFALRAQSAREVRARVATDFNELVLRAVQQANRARQSCRVELRLARLLPTVVLDPERVARLLDSLLALALTNIPTGGVIRVATAVERQQVVLRLESSHPMSGPAVQQLGELGGAGTAGAVSTALARVIVGAHGGELTVQRSAGVAVGVTMRLPVNNSRWAVGQ